MYRLHLDIPLGEDEASAIRISKRFVEWVISSEAGRADMKQLGIQTINYRLGNDNDRQRSNYLDINENGHVSTKKIKVSI